MTAERRVRAALQRVAEGLELSALHLEREEWPWVSVGLCAALNAACVAALSGYPTAEDAHVIAPDDPDRIASLPTLLRRASDARYLSDPERLSRRARAIQDALALQALRNHVFHMPPSGAPADFGEVRAHMPAALTLIRHLVVEHPAFDRLVHSAVIRRSEHALVHLEHGSG